LANRYFEREITTRDLELRFAAAWRTKTQEIGALFEPGVAGDERLHLRV
jgi:hypothetical protein